ncbi:MAG: purine-nucleoside phosphorylase [bacterium]
MGSDIVSESASILAERVPHPLDVGLILGSGWGDAVEGIRGAVFVPYDEIEAFPHSTAPGHMGRFAAGLLGEKTIIAMQGRPHRYEGYTAQEVALPVRVMAALGAHTLVVTNAAGGVNRSFSAGDIMLIERHIDLMENTIRAIKSQLDAPPDGRYYDEALKEVAISAARKIGIELKRGCYVALTGPSFETPSEIRMIERLGGDAVGMSTVPEVVAAREEGMRILGISCISNMAAGISHKPISHSDVLNTTKSVKDKIRLLIETIIHDI